jgi:hypothetical protein
MARKESDLRCLEARFELKTSRNRIQRGASTQEPYRRTVKANAFLSVRKPSGFPLRQTASVAEFMRQIGPQQILEFNELVDIIITP